MQRHSFLIVALVSAAAAVAGCKSMTEAQRQDLVARQRSEAKADEVLAENQEQIAVLDAEERQLKLKVEASAARIRRQEAWVEARDLLGVSPERALAAVNTLLEADEGSRVAYEKARAEGNTADLLTVTVEIPSEDPAAPPTVREELVLPPMDGAERARMLLVRGTAHYDAGDTAGALRDFQEAFALDPTLRPARINYGKLLFAEQEYRAALAAWQVELDDGYRSASLLFLIGQALYELSHLEGDAGLKDAAAAAIREAFVANADDPEIRRWLGLIEYETGHYAAAIRVFEGILARDPLDTHYMELIANCLIQLGRNREAADRLEAVVRISGPTRARSLSLADLYAQLGLPDRAALWLERAYDGEAEAMPSADRLRLGYLLLDSGRLEPALAAFSAVEADAAEHGEAQSQGAQIELRLDRPDAAVTRLTGLFASRPSDGGIRLVAGDLHLRAERFAEALEAYSQAAALPDTAGAGLAGVAETYYEMGNLRKSIEYYQRAVEAAPAESAYRHALAEIRSELELTAPATGETASDRPTAQ